MNRNFNWLFPSFTIYFLFSFFFFFLHSLTQSLIYSSTHLYNKVYIYLLASSVTFLEADLVLVCVCVWFSWLSVRLSVSVCLATVSLTDVTLKVVSISLPPSPSHFYLCHMVHSGSWANYLWWPRGEHAYGLAARQMCCLTRRTARPSHRDARVSRRRKDRFVCVGSCWDRCLLLRRWCWGSGCTSEGDEQSGILNRCSYGITVELICVCPYVFIRCFSGYIRDRKGIE